MRTAILPAFVALIALAGCQTMPPPGSGNTAAGASASASMTAWSRCLIAAYGNSRPSAGSADRAADAAFASCTREEQAMAAANSAATGVDRATIVANYRPRLRAQLVGPIDTALRERAAG